MMDLIKHNELFLQNTQALFEVDQPLAYKLRALQSKRFSFDDKMGVRDDLLKRFVYEDEAKEKQALFDLIYPKMSLYPVLFFYGFVDIGIIKKARSCNQRIIIFEAHLELLAFAFMMHDFSEDLRSERIIIYDCKSIDTFQLNVLFSTMRLLVKTYELNIANDYYLLTCEENIKALNLKIISTIKQLVLSVGTSVEDSLIGLRQTCNNLTNMISHPSFHDFLAQNKGKHESILIASSGPSLHKQLPLLKKYQENVFILCADSAYEMLVCAGITPDVVCCMERIPMVARFFAKMHPKEDEKITFLLSALMHEDTMKYMEGRNYLLVNRPLSFPKALGLDKYGYLGFAHSVAHMNYELATRLGCKNIILIGQDLAYAKDGSSHSPNHAISTKLDSQFYEEIKLPAYGGKGEVSSHMYWEMFKQTFEYYAGQSKLEGVKVYNCTQGGARIEGVIEASFKETAKRLFTKPKPAFIKLEGGKSYEKDKMKLKKRLNFFIKQAKKMQQNAKNLGDKIQNVLKHTPNDLAKLKAIDKECFLFRQKFSKPNVLLELLMARTYQTEIDLSLLVFRFCKNEEEELAKIHEKLTKIYFWLNECKDYINLAKKEYEKALLKLK